MRLNEFNYLMKYSAKFRIGALFNSEGFKVTQ